MTLWQKIKLLHWWRKNKETMIKKLKSRKLWAAVVGAALAAFGVEVGLPADALNPIIAVIVSYIVGQGIADLGAAGGSQGID